MKLAGIILGLLFWSVAYLIGIRKRVGIIPTVHVESVSDRGQMGTTVGLWLFLLGLFTGVLPWGIGHIPDRISIYLIVFIPLIILMAIYWTIRTYEQQE